MATDIKTSQHSTEVFDSDKQRGHRNKISELFGYRYLLQSLVSRDLKVRYRNSILGILWSLLNPLLMMMVYTVLFTILIPNDDIQHYPIFILVALIPWQFLSSSVMAGTTSITNNAPLLKKVYFPRLLLPSSVLFSNLVNFLLAFIVLIVLLYVFGIGLTKHALWVPAILFTQMVFMLGIMLILSVAQAFYRDTMMIVQVGMLAWFFLTPVFYPFERLTDYAEMAGVAFNPARLMRWLNPMASIIDGYRTVLWGNLGSDGPGPMDMLALLRIFIMSLIILLIGYLVFYRFEHLFGEKL